MEFWKQFQVVCMFAVWQTTVALPVETHRQARASRSTSSCKTPDNLESLLTSVNSITDGVTYLRSVNWTDSGMFDSESKQIQVTQLTNSTVCTVPNTQPDAPIWARSLCPWSLINVPYPDYYPNHMLEAKCECPKCVGNNINACEPITRKIRVLKKQNACIDGFNIYKEETILVAVACVCTEPRVVPPKNISTTTATTVTTSVLHGESEQGLFYDN